MGPTRRADEFERLVGGDSGDPRYDELLTLVAQLRALPEVMPRPEFSAGLRERLMTEAETALVRVPPRRTTPAVAPRRRERRVAALVGGLTLVGATGGVAVASQGALPGDPLYGVKRALENVHTQFAFSDAAKGRDLLSDASGRLDEVQALAAEGGSADQISGTLDAFTHQAGQGSNLLLSDYAAHHDQDSIATVRDFAGTSVARLATLEASLPAAARPALLRAASQLFAIDTRAQSACPSCGGAGITSIPPNLVSETTAGLGTKAPASHQVTHPQAPGSKGSGGNHPQSAAPSLPAAPGVPGPSGVPTPGAPAPSLGDPLKSIKDQLSSPARPTLPAPGGVVSSLAAPIQSAVGGVTSALPTIP